MTTVRFTRHALERYRRRIPAAGRVSLDELSTTGKVRFIVGRREYGCNSRAADAVLLCGDAVFPLLIDPTTGDLVAVTCLRRFRPPKADRRARRELQREGLLA